jgi:Kdo2-lipid IVA lauroyltransferase/acyltransferase
MTQLLARLPLRVLHALGRILGWAIYGISPTYRRHVRENLAAAGYRDARLRRAAIAEAGKMVLESPRVWLRPRAETLTLLRGIDGLEHYDAARAGGKAIVLLTPHIGCFEICAQAFAERHPITVLYRPSKHEWLQPVIDRGRAQPGVSLASADLAGVRLLLAALKRRETVGILPDQVPGVGEGEWAEFFGRPAYTMTLAAKLASRADVVCLLVAGERLPRGAGFMLRIRPLPPALPGESGPRHVNRAIETMVRLLPAQYLWGYNRYKTPAGAPPPPRAERAPPPAP